MRLIVRDAPVEAEETLSNAKMPEAIRSPANGNTTIRVICTCTDPAGGKYSRSGDTDTAFAINVLQDDYVTLGVNGNILNLHEIANTHFNGKWSFSGDTVSNSSLT
jgi:hypothetical protein